MSVGGSKIDGALAATVLSVREALWQGAEFLSRIGIESARIDAELLLGQALGWTREELYSNPEALLAEKEKKLFQVSLQRRARKAPISYITGHREFWSLDFMVTRDVLIPRPETERLVEVMLQWLGRSTENAGLRILDLGTGSGAIAVSLAHERSDLAVWASDLSADALEVAEANARRHGVIERVHFLCGDAYEPVEDRRGFFHAIISNPPYVRRDQLGTLPTEVRLWEPRLALDGGFDGLDLYRRIIQDGHLYLGAGGLMALEIGPDMKEEISRLFANSGRYSDLCAYRDYAGRDRVVIGTRLATD